MHTLPSVSIRVYLICVYPRKSVAGQAFCAIVRTLLVNSKRSSLPMYEVRSGTFIGAVVLAVGLILSTTIGGWFFVKGKRGDQTITVTGSARKRIKSDLVIWRSAISYQARRLLMPIARFQKPCPA